MRQNLLETYGKQIAVAEAYVNKNFGKDVSSNTKLTTAVLLDNTNRWISESLNESLTSPTTRSDLGAWKKFCLNLTNIAVPSLIANDLVIVHPMTSYSGSIAYLKYVALTDKNGMKGKELNSVFRLGDPTIDKDARMNYTSQAVVETTDSTGGCTFAWGPVLYNAADYETGKVENKIRAYINDAWVVVNDSLLAKDAAGNVIGIAASSFAAGTKIAYKYNQEVIPATDIPTIGPKMEHIALVAEPRRIAVKYDQITAFQAKTDYGFSLDKQIAEQACGELAYEIDTEILDMLRKGAGAAQAALTWSKALPVGVSKFEHYNGFLEVIEAAKTIIYNRTQKFEPNYMVISREVMNVLRFVNGFTASKVSKMNGPYKAGEIDNLSVYVSPKLEDGNFFFGLNGSDMMSSAGVYAPYMAIVPTQLLGTPDGGLQQGFSTWYAKHLLNENLLVAGKITD